MILKKYILSVLLCLAFVAGGHAYAADLLYTNGIELPVNNGDEDRVVVYPNPAQSFTQIKIVSEKDEIAQISVYGILGNQVYAKSFKSSTNKTIQLNVQKFKKGKYLIKVTFKDGTSEVKTLIKS